MRIKKVFLLIGLVATLQVSLAQVTDDFSDGDFTFNPVWTGMDTNFLVNGVNQLQLDAPSVTDESFLTTNSQAIHNATWQFDVLLDFNPSSSNRAYIYLTANQADLTQPLNGYFVMVGSTADEVSLYRQSGSSTTKIIDGTDGLVDVSAPNVRIRVTRDDLGNWELFADTSAGFTGFASQGMAQDVNHTQSSVFGFLCDYTSTRSDKFFFDNVVVTGTAVPDTTKPIIDSVVVQTANLVSVYFNEALTVSSAQANANYSVNNGIGNPSSVLYNTGNNSVELNFSSALLANTSYNLTVQNVEDLAGNAIVTTTLPIVFTQPISLSYRDVVINEIFADPTPVVGLPEVEYVEILNTTNQAIPLDQMEFSDASSTESFPSVLLPPSAYAIICDEDDTALFNGMGLVIGLASLPALNNTGDDLSLTYNAVVIDEVSYESSWYSTDTKSSGGWSLEQVNPFNPCSGKNNWKESENLIGGTPGAQNSVYDISPDVTAPEVQSILVNPPAEIIIKTNEQLETSSTAGISATITPSLGNLTVNYTAKDELQVITQNPMVVGVAYVFTINGITDCAGNTQTQAFSTEIGNGIEANAYDILINEIYANPGDATQQEEFVELYNRTDSLVTLNNLLFADASSSVSLPAINIAPKSYAVLLGGVSTGSEPYLLNGVWYVPFSSFPSLNNSGDDISIANVTTGDIIHAVSYSNTWYTDENKASGEYSLELVNPLAVCASGSNWREPVAVNHTMGEENTVYNPSTPNAIRWKSAQITADSQFVIQATGAVSGTLLNMSLSPNLGLGIPNATNAENNQFSVETNAPFLSNSLYELSIDATEDCEGNLVDAALFTLRVPQKQDIVINEVLFNPYSGASDFVELYNRGTESIDLNGWTFDYLDTKDERATKTLVDTSMVIEPGEYVVFTEDKESVLLNYSGAVEANLFTMDLPTYANDEGRVTLVSNLTDTIDDFAYSEDYHFDLLRDVDGISLERINPDRTTNDPTNWHSASEMVEYATPGYQNSQYALAANINEVTVSPETFSPDQDGYNDVVNIAFKLEQNGYVANIKVYDPEGRMIRDLVNNRLLGKTDVVSWDGIRDDAQKAEIGIYVIFIELYDLNGDVKHYKETCVLATRF